MEIQKKKLAKEMQFSEITFEITDVYLSGKDNDTVVSEILSFLFNPGFIWS